MDKDMGWTVKWMKGMTPEGREPCALVVCSGVRKYGVYDGV